MKNKAAQTLREAAAELGRIGGKKTSEAKTIAARANAKKPRKKTATPKTKAKK